jgi:hypothetical protein
MNAKERAAEEKDEKARIRALHAPEHVSKKRPTLTKPFGRAALQRPDGYWVYLDLDALRASLLERRWDDQGGFYDYRGDDKWGFISKSIDLTPDLFNGLLALAGITPDEIIPRGECETCRWSDNGRHRDWGAPCCGCGQPYMSRYAPKRKGKRR